MLEKTGNEASISARRKKINKVLKVIGVVYLTVAVIIFYISLYVAFFIGVILYALYVWEKSC